MTPHILLTTDLSEESLRAFEPVGAIASALGARITLLHVAVHAAIAAPVGEVVPPADVPVGIEEMTARARERLVQLRSRLPADVPVEPTVIEAGAAAQAITDWARENGVDYVAMATHGRSGLARMLLGSVAENVLRHSAKPMLLFPRTD